MTTFDVHQHFLPQQLVDELRARREPPRIAGSSLELGEGTFPFEERDNDLGERIALLDRDGIDVAVISLAPTMDTEGKPELEEAYNEGMREVVAAAGGRLRAFAAGACLEGFAGVCVSAQRLVGGLGDLPDELTRMGQVLFVHPGPPGAPAPDAPPWWTGVVDYTAQMQAAYFAWLDHGVEQHPDLNVVFAVLAGGGPFQLERLRSRGGDPELARHSRHPPRHGLLRRPRSGALRRRGRPRPAGVRQRSSGRRPCADARRPGRARRGRPRYRPLRQPRPTLRMTDHAPTPLEPAPPSLGGDRPLLLKREDVHELGAFKWRGALPVITGYRDAGASTVVTASTGNHGAATAWAASRLGLQAIVYAPQGATQAKVSLIEQLGAEIRLVGSDLDEAKDEGRRHADANGLPFFEDGAEMAQYEGYGSIADEILDQVGRTAGRDRRARGKWRPPGRHRPARLRPRGGDASDRRRRQGRPGHGRVVGGRRHRGERPQRDLR